ncbi:MAG: heavy metal translocating P-type ATPase metal-binding domain-containing protein [Polyangiaceae bacterium]
MSVVAQFTPLKAPASAAANCLHCGAKALPESDFCCAGCKSVYALLAEEGLLQFYALGGGKDTPARDASPEAIARLDRKWLEPIVAEHEKIAAPHRVDLGIQGMHCSACVWLLEALFKRSGTGGTISVSPTEGLVTLYVTGEFPLVAFVDAVERCGYLFGSPSESKPKAADPILWRMGVCIALAMNAMILSLSFYTGLREGPTFRIFHAVEFGLACISVLVGGPVFFKSAWRALRQGALHLDVPIALGIVLAFTSSAINYARGRGGASYFDTLATFIALMLVGRFLQERVLAANRARVLSDNGLERILVRRREGDQAKLVPCTEVAAGDKLMLAARDVAVVDVRLLEGRARFSLDWIRGESDPVVYEAGDVVPAGACAAEDHALEVEALSAFSASPLPRLLRRSHDPTTEAARQSGFWSVLARYYVRTVLSLAVVAFFSWLFFTGDLDRALNVVTALLIVTCPCAFGIAVPLAYDLTQSRLRAEGFLIRSGRLLDRLVSVSDVVCDKTGTLTEGTLVWNNASAANDLAGRDRAALARLALASNHPKSQAVARGFEGQAVPADAASLVTREVVGKGVEGKLGDDVYRLGSPRFACPSANTSSTDLSFSRNGELLLVCEMAEKLRPDAATELHALKDAGLRTWILSGDTPEKALAVGKVCGIGAERTFGDVTPDDKAAFFRSRPDMRALFLGDGLNDGLAAQEAFCVGTPALDRPFMASRADFYVVTPGLAPIRKAFAWAKRLRRVVRRTFGIALAYNVVTVGLAAAGLMSPLVCAIIMPVSSLSTVLSTTFSLRANKEI